MPRYTIILFLVAAVIRCTAGSDGYLRYCEPLAIRFAAPSTPPPLVNELILAMDLPPTEDNAESSPDQSAADVAGELFNSDLIRDLIVGSSGGNDTQQDSGPKVISTRDPYEEIVFPDIPLPAPTQPQTEAQTMDALLGIFRGRDGIRDRGRRDGTVVGVPITVPPPEFTPPVRSSSTYIVE